MNFRDLPIRRKLALLTLTASIFAVMLACLGFAIYERENFRADTVSELTALADTLGANTAASLAFNDQKTAHEMLGALRAEGNILAACLYDNQGRIFAEYRRAGRALSAVSYLGSRTWLGMWARRMADWWRDHDLLLTPTLGAPPPELGWFTAAGPQQEGERIISFIPYTAQFNMTGQPAISLPLHTTPEGLPVGVQLAAAYGREDLLIRVASQLEEAAPWSGRHPPVHA